MALYRVASVEGMWLCRGYIHYRLTSVEGGLVHVVEGSLYRGYVALWTVYALEVDLCRGWACRGWPM